MAFGEKKRKENLKCRLGVKGSGRQPEEEQRFGEGEEAVKHTYHLYICLLHRHSYPLSFKD